MPGLAAQVGFRVTEREKRTFEELALESGMGYAAWLRAAARQAADQQIPLIRRESLPKSNPDLEKG